MMYSLRKTGGFTLIEIIVSVALFSVVMTIVASAYLNLLNLDRQTRATNDIVNNLDFVVSTMARSIRTGTDYQCGGTGGTNCPITPSSTFAFVDDQGNTVTYSWDSINQQITECYGAGCTITAITDPRIKIDTLHFYVRGAQNNTDQIQPQVIFVLHGTISVNSDSTPISFTIQTSATQRQIDI
jgi:prepilin-type N-terminal cleavage/methylation domain-containing protein